MLLFKNNFIITKILIAWKNTRKTQRVPSVGCTLCQAQAFESLFQTISNFLNPRRA